MAQKKFIIDGGFQTSDDSIIAANLEMTGHILPTVDSDGSTGFDLGSTTKKWRDLYLSEGSLYIDGQKVIESNSGTIVVQADPNQSLTTQVSGTGVLTLTSATSVNINGTLQMAAGKKITDVGGNAVTFGDKLDMDSNKIENVGTPTAATDGANKSYVDSTVSDLVNGAPGALDTLNELANALGDDEDFAATMTTALGNKAATTYVDTQDAAVTLAFQNADLASAATINAAWAAADTAQTTAITSAYQTYADQAEADAEAAAATDATTKADAAQAAAEATASADATAKANAAQAAAESTASADATSKANAAQAAAEATAASANNALQTAMETYADTAEQDAISTASSDATTKAAGAESAANTYTDNEIAALINAAPGTMDTLNEIAASLGDDANFAATMTTSLAAKAATTYVDSQDAATLASAQTYADTAEADAISTASSDATAKANAAQQAAEATASTDATNKATAAQSNAEQTAAADATSKDNAQTTAITTAYTTAIANAVSGIEANISTSTFHSSVQDVTSAATLAYTFSDIVSAEDYTVYVNRQLVRPAELSSVNLSTGVVTFASSVIEVGDEIEVKGWKFGS